MIRKIKEVQKALEAGCYHCALALVLTFPDICGSIAYPELKGTGKSKERYEKWYDEYVALYYNFGDEKFPNGTDILINGYACYLLRCAYLHNGCYDFKKENPEVKISKFNLHYDKHTLLMGSYNSVNTSDFSLDVDVSGLCGAICRATTDFYNKHKEQFEDELILDYGWDDKVFDSIFS